MLAVDSKPSGAEIFLNGKQQNNPSFFPWKQKHLTTAAKIKNILPGEYDLVLEREGYWPFHKKINIYSGQTTFIEDINLFRSDLPFLVYPALEGELQLSVSKKYLYSAGESKIINLKDTAEKTWEINNQLPIYPGENKWLQNSDQFFLAGQWIDAEKNNSIDYQSIVGGEAFNWRLEEATGRLYYQNKEALGYYDINQKSSRLILNQAEIIDYYPIGGNIFLIIRQDKKTMLQRYEISSDKTENIGSLPSIGDYRFINNNKEFLEIYDYKNRSLYLINTQQTARGLQQILNALSWQWLDINTILYNNSWEIRSFDISTNKISLITRVGEEIKRVIWNKNKNYFIFTTDKTISAINREQGIITTIFKTEKISSPVLDEKGGNLYFWAKIGQQEGVYHIMLQ